MFRVICTAFALGLLLTIWHALGSEQLPLAGRAAPLRGLIAFGNLYFVRHGGAEDNTFEEPRLHPDLYVGATINCRWATLEPSRGRFKFACIDNALVLIRAYNAMHRKRPLAVELRVWVGTQAPEWAKSLDGGPISIAHNGGSTIGPWWMPDYRAAWKTLQDALAASYDKNPLIRENAVTSCALESEPFIAPLGKADIATLRSFGYSDALAYSCLRGAVADYSSWTKPALIFPFSPMRTGDIDAPKFAPQNVISLMRSLRAAFGQSATIGNQALSSIPRTTFAAWYAYMCPLKGPVEFQIADSEFKTFPPEQDTAFAVGQKYCMTQLEMWNTSGQGSVPNVTLHELQKWSTALGGYSGN